MEELMRVPLSFFLPLNLRPLKKESSEPCSGLLLLTVNTPNGRTKLAQPDLKCKMFNLLNRITVVCSCSQALEPRLPKSWIMGNESSRCMGRVTTVLRWNVASGRSRHSCGNPNCSVDGHGYRDALRQCVHAAHASSCLPGCAFIRWRAGVQLQLRTPIGAERGRRVGARAEREEVVVSGGQLDRHVRAGRVGDGELKREGGGWSFGCGGEDRLRCEEVVEFLPSEELYKNLLMASRLGGKPGVDGRLTMNERLSMRYEKLAGDEGASVRSDGRDSTAEDGRSVDVDPELEAEGSWARFLIKTCRRTLGKLLHGAGFCSGVPDNGGNLSWYSKVMNHSTGAEHRLRKTVSDRSKFGGNGPFRQGSVREFTHHAATETYLITRLAITLLKLLGFGTRWFAKFIRLVLYATFLMPGFIQVGYFYYFDKRILRSIIYGDQPRNRFDLYLPPNSDKLKPVVIFITGGAWVIGYKAWGSLLAQQLLERDIIVACIDYRNFPQGCISEMISDVSTGIGYVYQNIKRYGGDPNMVYLTGQSAGAHLAACALIMQAEKELTEDAAKLPWKSSQINAYMAISGGYNLIKLVEHFHKRGLYRSIMLRIMDGEKSLPKYSPEYMVKKSAFKKAVEFLPPITLFHGTGDYSIPHQASEAFADALRSVGAQVNTIFYPDKTHTDLFLQDPMRGGKDELLADILAIVHASDEEARAEDIKKAYCRRRLVPEYLLQLARVVSPF